MNITNKKSVVTLKGNILWIDVADEIEFTFADYLDIKKAAFKLANRKPVYTLIKLGNTEDWLKAIERRNLN